MTGIKWWVWGNFAIFFPNHIFAVVNKPAVSAFRVPKGYGFLIVVVYSPEKTIGTLVGVSSTLFSSNLKKRTPFLFNSCKLSVLSCKRLFK